MMNDFDAGVLFVVEASIEVIAINKDVDTLALEIVEIIEHKVL